MNKIKKFITNPFVQKWLIVLFAFVAAIFIAFMLYMRSNSIQALQLEYTSYSELQTERLTATLDNEFASFSRITALLAINNMIKIYLFDEHADELFTDLHNQIYNQLLAYKEGFPAIDSIYLFPTHGGEVFLSSSRTPTITKQLKSTDKNVLPIGQELDTITFIPRTKNELYPHLMTIYLPVIERDMKALIVLNINISKIPVLLNEESNTFQDIYIISDGGELLYRKGQQYVPEPLNIVPQLKHFDPSQNFYSEYVSGAESYIYVQEHSNKYDWYYVTVSMPQSYISKNHDIYSSLITLLPWLLVLTTLIIILMVWLFSHPIRSITDFLDDPLAQLPENISEPETRRIIQRLMYYIQTNHTLAAELNKQLEKQHKATYLALQSQINPHFLFNTLNLIRSIEIEALGFDHKAPEMTLALSRLLQYALDSARLVMLQTEFKYTELYLLILNHRHKGKLNFVLQNKAASADIMVPKLILQPLIENAVFHGCSPKTEKNNSILAKAEIVNNRCQITIKDNGVGMTVEDLNALREKLKDRESITGESIGLQNVVMRMHLIYGDAFTIQIDSQLGKGTCILLTFPI